MVFNWELNDVLGEAILPDRNIEIQKRPGGRRKGWIIFDRNVSGSQLNLKKAKSRKQAIQKVERFFLAGEVTVE